MDLQELYTEIGGDYEGTISRLHKKELVEKFVKKFKDDTSFASLEENLDSGNIDDAFRAAHTLKGVAINLGFTKLYEISSDMTERLRHKQLDGVEDVMKLVESEYMKTIEAINQLQ